MLYDVFMDVSQEPWRHPSNDPFLGAFLVENCIVEQPGQRQVLLRGEPHRRRGTNERMDSADTGHHRTPGAEAPQVGLLSKEGRS